MTASPSAHPAPLIDIGINLAHDSYDADREAVIRAAHGVGVVQMVVTGSSLESTARALEFARSHPGVLFATAGVHPHHATDFQEEHRAPLAALASEAGCVAVGECGLDYFRNYSPREAQLRAFHWQLEIAAKVRKPVFLHQRDAHDDFVAVLREHSAQLVGGVAHCFTAGARERDAYLELGLAIGITGWICDERRGTHLHAIVRHIPAGRLLLETDGPYLLPRDLKPAPASRRNEPQYLPHVAAAVARARGETLAELAAHTTDTARTLFGLPCPPETA